MMTGTNTAVQPITVKGSFGAVSWTPNGHSQIHQGELTSDKLRATLKRIIDRFAELAQSVADSLCSATNTQPRLAFPILGQSHQDSSGSRVIIEEGFGIVVWTPDECTQLRLQELRPDELIATLECIIDRFAELAQSVADSLCDDREVPTVSTNGCPGICYGFRRG